MGLLKTIVISAAIYGAYRFLKEENDHGKTRLDEFNEKLPDWLNKMSEIKDRFKADKFPETF